MLDNWHTVSNTMYTYTVLGRIQDFKLWGTLKKIAPIGGRRENFLGISCEKSRFNPKKLYFFQFYGGHAPGVPPPPPPGSAPAVF